MGFSSVVLVGHDDGGLLALMAAQKVQESLNSSNVSMLPLFPASRYFSMISQSMLYRFVSHSRSHDISYMCVMFQIIQVTANAIEC